MPHLKKNEWRFITAGWTIYAVYMAIASYVISARLGRPISWSQAIVNDFLYAGLWLLLTPLVLWLARRFRFERGHSAMPFTIHLGASLILSFIHKGVHWLLVALFVSVAGGRAFSWDTLYANLLSFYDYGLQLYWILLAVNYVLEYAHRLRQQELKASQLQTQLVQAQLQALRMQIHPHFLFNTLHTIAGLIRSEDKQKAVRMISGLSDFLRATLEGAGTQEVPLRQELDMVKRYLEIQQVRFSGTLQTEFAVEPSALDVLVPNFVLQPLVENAIVHGAPSAEGEAGRNIVVSAIRQNGTLMIEIRDNGPGLDSAKPEGIGMKNTRDRLQHLYGDRQSFAVTNAVTGGVQATLSIPWHTA
jgi:two-component system, LytTR family, sensor kinase